MDARARIQFAAIFSCIFSIGAALFACSDDSSDGPHVDAGAHDASDATVADATSSSDGGSDANALSGDPCGDVTGLQNGAAWPMTGGCPKRGGNIQNTGPSTTTIRFRAPVPAKGTSPIIGAAGNLYVATADGRVVLIDLTGDVSDAGPPAQNADAGDAGDDASATDTSDGGEGGAPNVGTALAIGKDSVLLYGESDENAYALSAVTGLSLWGTPLGASVISSPVVSPAGNVYFATNAGTLAAIAVSSGKIAWTAQTHDTLGTSAPAIGDDQSVYVGSSDKHLYAFTKDGAPRFQFPTSDAVAASPAVAINGVVVVADMSGTLYSIDPSTGNENWHVSVGAPVQSGCALGFDATIYCSANDGKVHAFDRFGNVLWTYATSGIPTTPIVDEVDVVYVGSTDTHLYAIDGMGKLRFAVSVFGPVRAQAAMGLDGAVYVTTDTEVVGVGP